MIKNINYLLLEELQAKLYNFLVANVSDNTTDLIARILIPPVFKFNNVSQTFSKLSHSQVHQIGPICFAVHENRHFLT